MQANKEPTQGEIKELWERCGFSLRRDLPLILYSGDAKWLYPDGGHGIDLPDIDLNNLFKYAVPKLSDIEITKSRHSPEWVVEVSTGKPIVGEMAQAEAHDLAIALFRAIQEVFNAKLE